MVLGDRVHAHTPFQQQDGCAFGSIQAPASNWPADAENPHDQRSTTSRSSGLDDPVTVAVDLIPIDASRRVRKTRCLAVCARGSALIAHPRRKSGIQRALEPVGARAPVGLPVGEWVSRCSSDRRTWRRIRAEREGTSSPQWPPFRAESGGKNGDKTGKRPNGEHGA